MAGLTPLVRFFLRGEFQLNQRDGFLYRPQRHRVSRGRVAGKIDGFQLGSHFFAHLDRGDDIDDVEDLLDN